MARGLVQRFRTERCGRDAPDYGEVGYKVRNTRRDIRIPDYGNIEALAMTEGGTSATIIIATVGLSHNGSRQRQKESQNHNDRTGGQEKEPHFAQGRVWLHRRNIPHGLNWSTCFAPDRSNISHVLTTTSQKEGAG